MYPCCFSFIGPDKSHKFEELLKRGDPQAFRNALAEDGRLPPFLSELARLEYALYNHLHDHFDIPQGLDKICVNPSVNILRLSWKNLALLVNRVKSSASLRPVPGEEFVIIWRDPESKKTRVRRASSDELLALKILVEELIPERVAEEGNLPVGKIDMAIDRAIRKGILLSPKSLLRRDPSMFPLDTWEEERFLTSRSFTLQWHITQACDLNCRHCYDRSIRKNMEFYQALRILDDLRLFCRSRFVRGAISFTGGNPFLYPHFMELYRAASERGFSLAILGNPVSRENLERLLTIQKPTHFQVSLEGLQEHNDYIRGQGHFTRTIEFLKVLRDLKIFSMVMLTLTKDNMHQILPLTELLRDLIDRFHFNRLSMVGEGSALKLPARDEYVSFLESYIEATVRNPILGYKDNLINIIRYKKGLEPFGGCTGYGCGAAFNFLAVLPDGEVHACRKLPSPVGDIFKQSISEIYDSEIAQRYRTGSIACRSCPIRPVCGGCLASSYSHGLDIFKEKDPFCFMDNS